jgi:hypothetical protein
MNILYESLATALAIRAQPSFRSAINRIFKGLTIGVFNFWKNVCKVQNSVSYKKINVNYNLNKSQ